MVRGLLGLALVAVLAACTAGDPSGAVSPSHPAAAESAAAAPKPDTRLKGLAAASGTTRSHPRALTNQEAYDALYALVTPSDRLIDDWNAAVDAENWALVRTTSGRLADALRSLQTEVLAQPWPADATSPAQDFATALEDEINWYSVVSIATSDAETWAALDEPWSGSATTASTDLWKVLEQGLATGG